MKKIVTTVMALTLALGMSVTAIAAPSPAQGVGPGTEVTKVDVAAGVTLTDEETALVNAWLEMDDKDDDKWNVAQEKSIPSDVANAVEAAAATADKNASVLTYGEVNVSPDIAKLVNDGKITVTLSFTLTGEKPGDDIVALVKVDGKWVAMKTEVVADNTVKVTFTHFSPLAFVQRTAKTTTTTTAPANGWAGVDMAALWAAQTKAGTTSPKTGEAGVVGFALIAVACGAALVFTKKKFA